ncbi:Conserved hypothetical protein [Candidatus Protochlamydia naegleriophila]|uniref:ABC transporter domain-containing protein n=1 Tax=Candidatus Protochlamydia naegleriophila TaxID=389348 RepID=A0A0U5JCE6_9BACT|nr:ATP-binding cassette domain-containing protein [Candidatus Protochlamydia naegleriophila]CUI16506.1 Conserved hypothetical protein [Candidatus Protochlamydia naegleriophila]
MNANALSISLNRYQFQNSSTPFFENLAFQLERGKLHCLKGKNGSGKSTLFSLLRGNMQGQQCEGSITVHGKVYDLSHPQAFVKINRHLSLVNQRYDAMIADQFSFADNLQFACLANYPSPFKSLKMSKPLPDFLETFKINVDTPAYLLSGGQRQILALSMVLQKQPSILLLDEPTATLDPANARLVFEFLHSLAKNHQLTMLIISHDPELVEEFCDGSHLEVIVGQEGKRMLCQRALR